ncbi:hypothetical protein IRJ41_024104, partial [Triplophysa rosa]
VAAGGTGRGYLKETVTRLQLDHCFMLPNFQLASKPKVSYPHLATDQWKHHIASEVTPDVPALARRNLHICLKQTAYPGLKSPQDKQRLTDLKQSSHCVRREMHRAHPKLSKRQTVHLPPQAEP